MRFDVAFDPGASEHAVRVKSATRHTEARKERGKAPIGFPFVPIARQSDLHAWSGLRRLKREVSA
jgi:hypothetical protein